MRSEIQKICTRIPSYFKMLPVRQHEIDDEVMRQQKEMGAMMNFQRGRQE